MSNNSTLVRVGVSGMVHVGPLGTTLPTEMEAWPDGFTDVGYISDDGVVEASDEEREDFTAWQADSTIRSQLVSKARTFAFTMLESKAQTISLYHQVPAEDMTVTGTAPDQIVEFDEKGRPDRDLRLFGIDVIDGAYHRRFILPYAEVTERGDLTYATNSMISYEVTVTAYPGPDGVAVKRRFKEAWAADLAAA